MNQGRDEKLLDIDERFSYLKYFEKFDIKNPHVPDGSGDFNVIVIDPPFFNITTKDIDFGFPSQRKKVYKVYLTFRGNGTNAQVHYGVNGLDPALTFFPITSGTDGSSTGTGAAAKCIAHDAGVTDWLTAELKPAASINNISSIRVKVSGDGSATIHADFEINDISIVYRIKNTK